MPAPAPNPAAWAANSAPTPRGPKKSRKGLKIGLGAAAALVVIAIASSGGSQTKDDSNPAAAQGSGSAPATMVAPPAPSAPVAPPAPVAAEKAPDDKAKDVALGPVETNDVTGWTSVPVTITNHTTKSSNYIVQIEFVDTSGTRLDETMVAANNVAPGQKSNETGQSFKKLDSKVTAKVTKVTRYAA
ncbi:hypothetical protein [Kitasatospora sp. NPDC002040]|uniref:hypothetical protein n=1 Tax=Kitasatospora sp. NPDC002040 TaxID=3154661 RepID=UPI003332D01B